MTPLCTNVDAPFLKDRILRLWNLTVSSSWATIATQSFDENEQFLKTKQGKILGIE
jgi:hypothetical protein